MKFDDNLLQRVAQKQGLLGTKRKNCRKQVVQIVIELP